MNETLSTHNAHSFFSLSFSSLSSSFGRSFVRSKDNPLSELRTVLKYFFGNLQFIQLRALLMLLLLMPFIGLYNNNNNFMRRIRNFCGSHTNQTWSKLTHKIKAPFMKSPISFGFFVVCDGFVVAPSAMSTTFGVFLK